jgi:aldehyde:ferredoxin oxidoreductase
MAGEFGYTGKILNVDLSSRTMTEVPTANYTDSFIGGLGMATKIWWDESKQKIGALDPENRVMFMTGPLGGLPGLAGSRWLICGKSPEVQPENFCSTAAGGSWGAYLKFAGYDGIVVQGKSEKPVYLLVQDGVAELKDASAIWGRDTFEVRDTLKGELGKSVRVAAIGPAGENMVPFANIVADEDAIGNGGFGAVMGSKKLKAIAVSGSGRLAVANPERLEELRKHIRNLLQDRPKPLPYSGYPDTVDKMTPQVCFGCLRAFDCMRATYKAADGEKGKFMCASGDMYIIPGMEYYKELNDVPFKATKLCDRYGINSHAVWTIIIWLTICHHLGALTDESTGIPLSKMGSLEFMETLLKKITFRDGFGDALAEGVERAADSVGGTAKGLARLRWGFPLFDPRLVNTVGVFDPRLLITTGAILATSPRQRVCEVGEVGHLIEFYWFRWLIGVEKMFITSEVLRKIAKETWGSEIAADFSTYEGKALAAKIIQDRYHAFDSLILCSWAWPFAHNGGIVSGDHIGDTLTLESRIYSAVTGNEIDQDELYRIGERIFNLERAILLRDGRRGRQDDKVNEHYYTEPLQGMPIREFGNIYHNPWCWAPGKDGKLLVKIGSVLDREKFEKMMDEYYQYRGWDVSTGFPKKARLEELGLKDIARDLEQRGLTN